MNDKVLDEGRKIQALQFIMGNVRHLEHLQESVSGKRYGRLQREIDEYMVLYNYVKELPAPETIKKYTT